MADEYPKCPIAEAIKKYGLEKRMIFWSSDWNIFQRGRAILKRAGFAITTTKFRQPKNGVMIHQARVPTHQFHKANKFVRENF